MYKNLSYQESKVINAAICNTTANTLNNDLKVLIPYRYIATIREVILIKIGWIKSFKTNTFTKVIDKPIWLQM